jgi:predicted metal-dependent peptidase
VGLRVESVCKEVEKKVEKLRDNIRIGKLTQTIIKLQRELDRSYNKKKRLEWASEQQ